MLTKATLATILFLAVIFFLHGHSVFKAREYAESGYYKAEDLAVMVEAGNSIRRVTMLLLGMFGIIILFRRKKKSLKINGILGASIIFLFSWAIVSTIWTDDIGLSIRRLILLTVFCIGALGIAVQFSFRQIIFIAFCVCGIFLFIGICTELFLGTLRLFQSGIQFAGLETGYRFCGTIDPNAGAWELSTILISAFFLFFNSKQYRFFFLASGISALLFLILSKTRTSFAAITFSLFVSWSFVASRTRKLILLLSIIAIVCLLYFALDDSLLQYAKIAVLLGRSDRDPETILTLTGRIPLWKELISEYVVKKPITGYGYGAKWVYRYYSIFRSYRSWSICFNINSMYQEILCSI